jgi:hypothetical protein
LRADTQLINRYIGDAAIATQGESHQTVERLVHEAVEKSGKQGQAPAGARS